MEMVIFSISAFWHTCAINKAKRRGERLVGCQSFEIVSFLPLLPLLNKSLDAMIDSFSVYVVLQDELSLRAECTCLGRTRNIKVKTWPEYGHLVLVDGLKWDSYGLLLFIYAIFSGYCPFDGAPKQQHKNCSNVMATYTFSLPAAGGKGFDSKDSLSFS